MYDKLDRKILDVLQENADLPVATIADRVGLSHTPCWRRIRRMEETGLIRKRVALVDKKQANVAMTVFIVLKASTHKIDWIDELKKVISRIPEIVEAYRLTGDTDYLLRVAVPDIESYDGVYKTLISQLEFSNVTSSIAMEELKFTTALPSSYLL